MDQPENVPFVFCQLFYQLFYQLLRTLSEPPISSAVSSRVHSWFLLAHDPQLAWPLPLMGCSRYSSNRFLLSAPSAGVAGEPPVSRTLRLSSILPDYLPMPAFVWTNTTNQALGLHLLEVVFNSAIAYSELNRQFLSGYFGIMPN